MEHKGRLETKVLVIIPFILYVSRSLISSLINRESKAYVYALHITPFFEIGFNRVISKNKRKSSNHNYLSVANEFTTTPGARFERDGQYSGEKFYKECLLPRFKNALNDGEKLTVDLDGTTGYGVSFLDASFGILAKEYGADVVLTNIIYISNEEPYLKADIIDIILDTVYETEAA
jgi:hypothetical protein